MGERQLLHRLFNGFGIMSLQDRLKKTRKIRELAFISNGCRCLIPAATSCRLVQIAFAWIWSPNLLPESIHVHKSKFKHWLLQSFWKILFVPQCSVGWTTCSRRRNHCPSSSSNSLPFHPKMHNYWSRTWTIVMLQLFISSKTYTYFEPTVQFEWILSNVFDHDFPK